MFASFARDLHKLMPPGTSGCPLPGGVAILFTVAIHTRLWLQAFRSVEPQAAEVPWKQNPDRNLLAKKNAGDFSSAKLLQLRPRSGLNISGAWHAWLPDT